MRRSTTLLLPVLTALSGLLGAMPQQGELTGYQKIDDQTGGLGPILADGDHFGSAVDRVGDFDGDGIVDLVVGAPHSAGGPSTGSAWILLMRENGTVRDRIEIDPSIWTGTWSGVGCSVAGVGDVDDNGVNDVAVATYDGAVVLLTMQSDGTYSHAWLYPASSFGGTTSFGTSIASLGDLDGDGRPEFAVGEPEYETWGGQPMGAVWIVWSNPNGSYEHATRITESSGGFQGALDAFDRFGESLARVGDLDGDGIDELAVGAPGDDDGGSSEGAVWILFLDPDGTVRDETKISHLTGSMPGLPSISGFGRKLGRLGDFDGNGDPDLLVASNLAPASNPKLWIVLLNANGTMRTYLEYGAADFDSQGEGFPDSLVGADFDGDFREELVVGAPSAEGGGDERGALYVGRLDTVAMAKFQSIGCGLNPAGSLVGSTLPVLGKSMGIHLDNPLGTQHVGSLPFLALSLSDLTGAGGCGTALPGWSMMSPADKGELIVGVPLLSLTAGAPWQGVGKPAKFQVPVPHDAALLGVQVYAQGAIVDPIPPAPFLGLTRAVRATIGV